MIDEPPEKRTRGDHLHSIAKVGLGSLPIFGAAAEELLSILVSSPLEKRRQQWFRQVGEDLRRLAEAKGLDLESLRENPAFIDVALRASQAALRTHQDEKLKALRAAVLNSATPKAPDAALQEMFIHFVDEFTEWHLRLLDLFDDPLKWGAKHKVAFQQSSIGGASALVLARAYPELSERQSFYTQIWKDLGDRGLVHTASLHLMTSSPFVSRTTDLGKRFLSFIGWPQSERE